jgi:SpoIID/LytB domain protein
VEPAEKLVDDLAARGLKARLWPVGLTPGEGEWQHREYRLLVESGVEFPRWQQVNLQNQSIVPRKDPIEVTLPAEAPMGFLHIEDSGGQRETFLQKAELSSPEPLDLLQVLVGEGFHWQHHEDLSFPSPLWVAVGSDGHLQAGVELDVEDYLASVNSSEMPAESPPEFLKAQVVAARSWLLANWGSHHPGESYTFCAGDHCQCYYGLSRIRESSQQAVENTRGQVLIFEGRICDARYAKSCGGVSEPAFNVWPSLNEPYLSHRRDLPDSNPLDLSNEKTFQVFQKRSVSGDACCAPGYALLPEALAGLADLYRWTERVSNAQLSQIIRSKSRRDLGRILDLIPKRRGPSGRLIELEIIGEKGRLTLTLELEIRRVLSRYHLPSSAFWIEREGDENVIFHGLGWGHGVGLCQVGAAALAAKGLDYAGILSHYYPNTRLQKIY